MVEWLGQGDPISAPAGFACPEGTSYDAAGEVCRLIVQDWQPCPTSDDFSQTSYFDQNSGLCLSTQWVAPNEIILGPPPRDPRRIFRPREAFQPAPAPAKRASLIPILLVLGLGVGIFAATVRG